MNYYGRRIRYFSTGKYRASYKRNKKINTSNKRADNSSSRSGTKKHGKNRYEKSIK